MIGIRCSACGAVYPINSHAWVCQDCGGLLEIFGAPRFDAAKIKRGNTSLWRYRALLSLPENTTPISMGEGWTPLIAVPYRGRNIYCKLDFLNPTGSFKDRGTTLIVSAVKAFGIERVVEDSSGNAAASLAGYAAYANLRATIFVPAHASPMKLAQIQVYGAELERVNGVREKSAEAAQAAARTKGAYYASHYYNPFFVAGMQTTAWEIWEQLGRAPDVIVMPAGHGTNMVGMYRGFAALRDANYISTLPRFIAAQAAQVAPIALAFARGANEPARVEPFKTIAEGIANSEPVHGRELLRIIRETKGAAISASEEEIRSARVNLARHGIFVEPTSATAIAVLEKVLDQIDESETVVVSLTGNGLKAPL
ncbi:MAG: pyridoxal-phosphate dependent enzyme [Chloroflexota bacterium]|nr:MAG: pyridoxal-phosphate dependent enzyme [Chloroflexota bacterium]